MAKPGYARCSTVRQDTAVKQAKLDVDAKNVWIDHGFTGKTMTCVGLPDALKELHSRRLAQAAKPGRRRVAKRR